MYNIKLFIQRYKSILFIFMIFLILTGAYINISSFGILSSLFIDDSTGSIDRYLVWSALGSISTSLAVMFALFQHSFQNRKRIKLTFDKVTLLSSDNCEVDFVVLSIANIGLRMINIQSWRWIIKGNKHFLTFPKTPYGQDIAFPISISSEESLDLYFPIDKFKPLMIENFDINKKLIMYVTDTVGSRYFLTTAWKISYYL